MLPVATPEPEVEISPFVPRSSVPIKFVQYNNIIAGNGNIDVQYAQHVSISYNCSFLVFSIVFLVFGAGRAAFSSSLNFAVHFFGM